MLRVMDTERELALERLGTKLPGGLVRFVGHNRHGVAITGYRKGDGIAEFVEAKYRARWQDLAVVRDGIEIAAIVSHPDTGKRIWWAANES